ncbi:YebC/PmpR family DNA-binding transcriptional regulator [Alphaproteobacteria bacterium]|nr:YebC/PmpR family DNA-binding transcriptional regulator [Alphaproteobacteria bacterium]
MAGHSKFKNIMHRKGAQDKKRAKVFSRLGREISVSVKTGGPDPDSNIRLRSAITAAKSLNMPKDNIDRAIKKGEGNDPDSNYEEVRYEGYGPEGIAIIVEAMTNNKNRTAAEIRSIFSKSGGNLGESGSVSFSFKRLGTISIDKKLVSEETLFDFVVENGSEDLDSNEDEYIIFCDQSDLHNLNEKIISTFGQTNSSELIWKSDANIDVDKETAEKLFKLLNALEDNEDVQGVSSNFEVSEKILASLTL